VPADGKPSPANPTTPDKPARFQAHIYPNGVNMVRVAVEKTTSEALTISLRQTGQEATLFQRYISKKHTQLALRLDMTDLADGNYEVVVQSASGRIIKQISVGLSRPVDTPRWVVAVL
jgi:hypothetical protein